MDTEASLIATAITTSLPAEARDDAIDKLCERMPMRNVVAHVYEAGVRVGARIAAPVQDDPVADVRYLRVTGGSGSTRMRLSQVPDWLLANPGAMIIGLRCLGF